MLKATSVIPQSLGPESLWLLYCTQMSATLYDFLIQSFEETLESVQNSALQKSERVYSLCLQMQASKKLKTLFWSHKVPRNQHCPPGAKNDQ